MADEHDSHQWAEGEGIAQAAQGSTAIVNIVKYENVQPIVVDLEVLREAEQTLDELPLYNVPLPAPPSRDSVLPPMIPNPLFVGREEELKAIAANIKNSGSATASWVQTVAVTGLGGIGKTQLASEFAHRYGRYFRGGVYWLNLSDVASAGEEIAACGGAGAMRLRPDFDLLSLEEQVREVKSAWQSELPRLLVFDNCDDGNSLLACRPVTGGCRVLVTSRGGLGDPALGVISLALEVLSREDSVELLRKHCRDMSVEDSDLDAVAEELGDLPLALDLAGRFLYRYRYAVTPSEYLEELRSPELLDHPSLRQVEGFSPTDHEMDIGRTFVVSYERLNGSDQTDQLAIALLARAAHFAPEEQIPRGLLLSAVDSSEESPSTLQREDALRRLADLGLLTTSETGLLRMHRLVAAFARREIDDGDAQTDVERAISKAAVNIAIQGQPVKLTTLMPHLRHASNAVGDREDQSAGRVIFALGISHYKLASYDESRPLMERAVKITTQLRGPRHWITLRQRSDLGVVIKSQGDFDGAVRVYQGVLEDQKAELDERHQDVASTLLNIGAVRREQGVHYEVLPRYRESLCIREEVLAETGPEDPERSQLLRDVAESLNNIGAAYMDLGRHREASPNLERALRIYETNLDEVHHERYANTSMTLGSALRAQKDYRLARIHLKKALDIHKEVMEEENEEITRNLMNLGALLVEQVEREGSLSVSERQEALGSALVYLEEALTVSKKLHSEDHPTTGGVLRALASVAYAEARHEDEVSYRERAEAIRQRAFDSAATSDELYQDAMQLGQRGFYDEAIVYQQHSLELSAATFGRESLQAATSMLGLSGLLQLHGLDGEACPHLEHALAIYKSLLGEHDPSTELVRESLSILCTQ